MAAPSSLKSAFESPTISVCLETGVHDTEVPRLPPLSRGETPPGAPLGSRPEPSSLSPSLPPDSLTPPRSLFPVNTSDFSFIRGYFPQEIAICLKENMPLRKVRDLKRLFEVDSR